MRGQFEKAELDRIRELADAQIQKIEEKVAAAERRFQNGTRFLTGKLAEYFETVPHKTTKTKASVRLFNNLHGLDDLAGFLVHDAAAYDFKPLFEVSPLRFSP